MASIPKAMRSLVAPKYCDPAKYEIVELPVPSIQQPDEVLVKIHAAAIITADTQLANGGFRMLATLEFPIKIGAEGSGIVVEVGSGVKSLKAGDAVYGLHFRRPLLPLNTPPGFCSEYAVTSDSLLLRKPPNLTFEEAASVAGSAVTAYQSIRRGLELMNNPAGSLEGKTVFMPAALSATGSVGAQMIKNVFGAEKLIATVSTPKVPLVEQLLPGIVDRVVNYKTQDVVKEVGKGVADFIYNTQWGITGTFPIANPQSGVIVSIASIPRAATIKLVVGADNVPFWMAWALNLAQWWYDWKLRGTNVKRDFVSGNPSAREDLEKVGEMIAMGKIKPVMTVVDFNDIDAVRRSCGQVAAGKGGLGRLVIKIA